MLTVNGLSRDAENASKVGKGSPLDLSNPRTTFFIQGTGFDDLDFSLILNGAFIDPNHVLHHKALHHQFIRISPTTIKVRVRAVYHITAPKEVRSEGKRKGDPSDQKVDPKDQRPGDSSLTITAINANGTAATFATSHVTFPVVIAVFQAGVALKVQSPTKPPPKIIQFHHTQGCHDPLTDKKKLAVDESVEFYLEGTDFEKPKPGKPHYDVTLTGTKCETVGGKRRIHTKTLKGEGTWISSKEIKVKVTSKVTDTATENPCKPEVKGKKLRPGGDTTITVTATDSGGTHTNNTSHVTYPAI